MDISSLGAMYLDDYRFDASLTSSTIQSDSALSFAEILQRTAASSDTASTSPMKPEIDKTDRLYELCLELETFLIKNLISSMRSTVMKSGLIEEGFAGKIYEDMLYDEYAKDFTRNANFGFAEQAYLQLTRMR